jgi:hypothetical protein
LESIKLYTMEHFCVCCGKFFTTLLLYENHVLYDQKCLEWSHQNNDTFIASYFTDLPKSPVKKVKPRQLGLFDADRGGEEVGDHFQNDDDDDEAMGDGAHHEDEIDHDDVDYEIYKMGQNILVEDYKLADPDDPDPDDEDDDDDHDDEEEDVDMAVEKLGDEEKVEEEKDEQQKTASTRHSLEHWKTVFGSKVDMTLMDKREECFRKGYHGSKFTVDQEARIELAFKLDKAKAPLNAFDSMLDWGQNLAPDRAEGLRGSRKTLVKELLERYGEEQIPRVEQVPLKARHHFA